MKRGPLAAALACSLVVGCSFVPTIALAGGSHGGRGGGMGGGGHPGGSQSRGLQGQHGARHHHGFTRHHGSHHHGFKHHSGFRPFFSTGGVTVWAPPPYIDGPVYYSPPTYHAPVHVLPPPTPDVVQYPHGRYERRGDGATRPYSWVWVPAPPAPPPPPAPAAAPPPPPASIDPPRERPPSANGSVKSAHQVKLYLGTGTPPESIQLYRWTDEQGVVHWTDRPEAVPPRYRTQAKSPPPP
jgi:Domain of unknown function (DUF4124)